MLTETNRTGYISYYSDKLYSQSLWVTNINQQNSLDGQSYQSKFTRHFYPRYYSPGEYTITCIASSQELYQQVAQFVRAHHKVLSSYTLNATNQNPNIISNTFMNLIIPFEQINVMGFIENFKLTKRGVYDPAPSFSFGFIPLQDKTSKNNTGISQIIQRYYNSNIGDAADILEPAKDLKSARERLRGIL